MNTHHTHFQPKHLPVVAAVLALLLLPVSVVGRGDAAAVATLVTIVAGVAALVLLVSLRARTLPRWLSRGAVLLGLVLLWLLVYAARATVHAAPSGPLWRT
jgi:hypothetical protein